MGKPMSFRDDHEMHKRKFSRNLGLGIVLAGFVAIIFALTVVKVSEGNISEAIAGSIANDS